ncbi:phospholipid-transporting ATPase IB-like isoform X1 [Macaca nemestrina]|uniref:phospholipid-transporting ATPase IB-like isoform X1 n=1 Tax=Macaca nemestrina TaxID=9545 RepID=UPI0039B92C1A
MKSVKHQKKRYVLTSGHATAYLFVENIVYTVISRFPRSSNDHFTSTCKGEQHSEWRCFSNHPSMFLLLIFRKLVLRLQLGLKPSTSAKKTLLEEVQELETKFPVLGKAVVWKSSGKSTNDLKSLVEGRLHLMTQSKYFLVCYCY